MKTLTFHLSFVLEAHLKKLYYVDSVKVSLTGNVYDFSVDYSCIDKCDK